MTDAAQTLAQVSPGLLSYFRRRVGDEHAADLLAETLTTSWRRVALLPEDHESARRWLFGIAHNVLLNDARSRRRQQRVADRLRNCLVATQAAPADSGIEVRDAISRLDGRLAEVVRLVHWEGFRLTEVGEIVGRPSSTVRNDYARAKDLLRSALGTAQAVEQSPV